MKNMTLAVAFFVKPAMLLEMRLRHIINVTVLTRRTFGVVSWDFHHRRDIADLL